MTESAATATTTTDADTDTDTDATTGRAALVTGGGSGIGLACAQRLARDGMRVTICGRSQERLDTALASLPDTATAVAADITDPDAMARVVSMAAPDGTLAAVVANAGGAYAVGPLMLVDPAAFEQELAVNVTGTFNTLRAAAPALVAGKGAAVAISSIAGALTHRYMAAYSVSKAGLDMLVRNAADELGRFGVRINGVRPGLVPTGASDPLVTDETTRTDYLDQMPLGRTGTVDDIAAAVSFLVGPESSWITGQLLNVDGGHSLRRGPDLTNLVGRHFETALGERLGPAS
ncbi:SDR family NAD(P)-dependent oxidoreductase [Desertimonas flava]|uniref:SDR family NAD(P)-dependent oxidoreductase n=1 Tax=Desertimonas flava TaxID=2064846 RepID=UPI000E3537A5|nr:SDR family oxidoreductase [Desertimonas flava]